MAGIFVLLFDMKFSWFALEARCNGAG
jgi:hypothetical protein